MELALGRFAPETSQHHVRSMLGATGDCLRPAEARLVLGRPSLPPLLTSVLKIRSAPSTACPEEESRATPIV